MNRQIFARKLLWLVSRQYHDVLWRKLRNYRQSSKYICKGSKQIQERYFQVGLIYTTEVTTMQLASRRLESQVACENNIQVVSLYMRLPGTGDLKYILNKGGVIH